MAEANNLLLSNGTEYPYQVVHSKRAKYIRIKLSQRGDLSVTLPAFTKPILAHDFLLSKREWIEKNLLNVSVQLEEGLPEILDLKLLQELWTVVYLESNESLLSFPKIVERKELILQVQGSHLQLNDPIVVTKALNNWCKKKSKKIFNLMVQELAELHGFHYQRLSIRAQKTRWGSCSYQKNINLNCKLLFMPAEVVRYVIIHELCHTIEMNHSSRFWSLVEDCDPQYKAHRRQLKNLGKEIAL